MTFELPPDALDAQDTQYPADTYNTVETAAEDDINADAITAPEDRIGDQDDGQPEPAASGPFGEQADNAADSDATAASPPLVPPPHDTNFGTAEGDDNLSPGERANNRFIARGNTTPTMDHLEALHDKADAVEWLGDFQERTPVSATFGGYDKFTNDQRLSPRQADRIVERQLGDFGSTLSRVEEGIEATAALQELTAEHAGSSVVEETNKWHNKYPGAVYGIGRHVITFNEDRTKPIVSDIGTAYSPGDDLRYDAPNGDIHLIEPDGSSRNRISLKDGAIVITGEEAHTILSTDTEYFGTLNKNLGTYKELLLQVADHAGFNRDDIVDAETNQVNSGYLLGTVEPVISSKDFQDSLPGDLRAQLDVYAQSIASRVNPGYTRGNMLHVSLRVGGYFRELARRHPR